MMLLVSKPNHSKSNKIGRFRMEQSKSNISNVENSSDTTIELFAPENDVLVIPDAKSTTETLHSDTLLSRGIDREIGGDTVDVISVPTTNQLELPNYMIDLSKVDSIGPSEFNAINAYILDEGHMRADVDSSEFDTAIYLIKDGQTSLLGYAQGYVMDKILPDLLDRVFSGSSRLYRDAQYGQVAKLVKQLDASRVRLVL